jgi:hypothetical protein
MGKDLLAMIKFWTRCIHPSDQKLKLSWHIRSEGLQTATQHTLKIRVNALRIDRLLNKSQIVVH